MKRDIAVSEKALVLRAKYRLQLLERRAEKKYTNSPLLKAALEHTLNCTPTFERHVARLEKSAAAFGDKELSYRDAVRRDFIHYQREVLIKQVTAAQEEAARRRVLLRTATPEVEMARCAADIFYWWGNYAWTTDPRNPVLYTTPFSLFDYQKEFISVLEDAAYVSSEDLVVEKSRDMGLTWLVIGWMVYHWLFSETEEHFLCASMRAEDVDKVGLPSTILEKARTILRLLPDWMIPRGFSFKSNAVYMKIVNPEKGSTIAGSTANGETGRGGRYRAIFLDEFAAVKDDIASATASAQSTNTRIFVSTSRGRLNYFAEIRHSGDFKVCSYHWKLHPWKDERWYRTQKLKMTPAQVAQELDIDYTASEANRVYPEYNDLYHVITWSEFANSVDGAIHPEDGKPCIPLNWLLSRTHDWGSSDSDGEHANVTYWFATAPEGCVTTSGADISGAVFCYREYLAPPHSTVRQVARAVKELQERCREQERMEGREWMSHEALSERDTYAQEHGLNYRAWKIDYAQGIAQLREYLEVEGTDPHPFRPQLKGTPKFFLISSDEEGECYFDESAQAWLVRVPKTSEGLRRVRAEFISYKWKAGNGGIQRPAKVFDDAMDCLRGAAMEFPPRLQRSEKELLEERIPDVLKADSIISAQDDDRGILYLSRLAWLQENKPQQTFNRFAEWTRRRR